MNFNIPYRRADFAQFLENFLPDDFTPQENVIGNLATNPNNYIQEATKLGECKSLKLELFEVSHTSTHDARVGLSREAFKLMQNHSFCDRALIAFVPKDNNEQWRFSLLQFEFDQQDNSPRVSKKYSNPRRYSFLLGEGSKTKTPQQYLIEKGEVSDFEDLQKRFSVEVLTKEFYKELFDWYQWALREEMGVAYPNDTSTESDDHDIQEHLIRLITRLMFVWFIKQKKLIPEDIFEENYLKEILVDFDPLSETQGNYYNAILQNLFFATLNRPNKLSYLVSQTIDY
ncbi:MAG: hypothetical protein LBU83_12185 [Bacteroidales bacterium]|jgi:hypothetical protein|nr:hypothetical protein [Bacteroidales bacterium]